MFMSANGKQQKYKGSTATVVQNSVLIISHITFQGCREHIFSVNLSQNSCIFSATFKSASEVTGTFTEIPATIR